MAKSTESTTTVAPRTPSFRHGASPNNWHRHAPQIAILLWQWQDTVGGCCDSTERQGAISKIVILALNITRGTKNAAEIMISKMWDYLCMSLQLVGLLHPILKEVGLKCKF